MVVKKSGQPRKAKPKKPSPQPPGASRRETWEHEYALRLEQLEQMARRVAKSFQSETWNQELYQQHPIKAKLMSGLLVRMLRFAELDAHAERMKLRGKMNSKVNDEVIQLRSEALELYTWTMGPLKPLPADEIQALLDVTGSSAAKAGLPFSEITSGLQKLEKLARKKPRGRPPARRPLAVTALEMKLANPKLTWPQLTEEICPCAKRMHDFYCQQAIRQEVIALKRVLRKYQISY